MITRIDGQLGMALAAAIALASLDCCLLRAQTSPSLSEGSVPNGEELVERIKGRRERAKSARFVWQEDVVIAAESTVPKGQSLSPSMVGPIPPADVTFSAQKTILFAGDKVHISENEPLWSDTVKEFAPRTGTHAWDGETAKSLSANDPRHEIKFSGDIFAGADDISSEESLQPFTLHFGISGADAQLNELHEASPTGQEAIIGDRTCVNLSSMRASGRSSYDYWVDPSEDYTLRRVVFSRNGKTVSQLDIEYEEDREFGWYPVKWTRIVNSFTGKFRRSTTGALTDHQFAVDAKDEDFQVSFPPDTFVADHTGEEARYFVARANGERRYLTDNEMRSGVNYQKILDSDTGEAADLRSGAKGPWGIVINVVVIVAIVVIMLTFKRNRTLG